MPKFLCIFIIFIVGVFTEDFVCSSGCLTSCIANYTCITCDATHEVGDFSCMYCPIFNPYDSISSDNVLYIRENYNCISVDENQVVSKTSWIPDVVEKLSFNESVLLTFNQNTIYDKGPCRKRDQSGNDYVKSYWFEFNAAETTQELGIFEIHLQFEDDSERQQVNLDVSTSLRERTNPNCYARHVLLDSVDETFLQIQINLEETDDQPIYLFVSTPEANDVRINMWVEELAVLNPLLELDITVDNANQMLETGNELIYEFQSSAYGKGAFSSCEPGQHVKASLFNVELEGNFRFVMDSRMSNRIIDLSEYTVDEYGNAPCVGLWPGQSYGILSHRGKEDGFFVMIEATEEKTLHRFSILSMEFDLDFNVSFQAICPDDCNSELGYGVCSRYEKQCICNDGYGADNCRELCYYNGEFTVGNSNERCFFGSHGCDYDCYCNEGYTLDGHLCVSQECYNGDLSGDLECNRGEQGCLDNCYCKDGYGNPEDGHCHLLTCGNGIADEGEECDGGVNCGDHCECATGFIQDINDPTSCMKEKVSTALIVGVSVASLLGFLCLFVVMIVLILLLTRIKSVDYELYRKQQDPYYLYLGGSKKVEGSEKQSLTPTDLDFGNEFNPTEINDTRFQRIELRNKSRNKWMLVIAHTPVSPKFVFHFEPEYVLVRPQRTGLLTSYLTLFCTTKIKDMKIPYTIWMSQSKKTLENVANVLKNKTFETWSEEDDQQMQRNLKGIIKHYHGNFTIKTEAVSSTFIDMDELNIGEEPIAEGAMGKVFVGSYRSVPVAIKQFRWENLTEKETEELKENVIEECLLFRKLRNPFVANYMGAVTYLPQVSMVIQFFVLGSLGEYLRKDSKYYFELPYHLKLKMLYDTSRGMEFLHENRILHLDMKPDNLLVNSFYADSACCVKITDFGTSRFVKKGSLDDKGLGTPIYVAPEAYEDVYSNASDTFAYGVTAWEIYHQKEPYGDFKSLFEIKDYVKSGKRLEFDEDIKPSLKQLISNCWNQDPEQRPTFEQITKELVKMVDDYLKESKQTINYEQIEEFVRERTERLNNLLSM